MSPSRSKEKPERLSASSSILILKAKVQSDIISDQNKWCPVLDSVPLGISHPLYGLVKSFTSTQFITFQVSVETNHELFRCSVIHGPQVADTPNNSAISSASLLAPGNDGNFVCGGTEGLPTINAPVAL
ncbi:hypothetical protein pdam_00004612 [Pocillopora damicornis]|uniref:Uncharacterized protein n=1 Tax=Pocillopora damicornis TaxID=46731 RepID=A0A3M6ULI9_POCDA|nr:hypothetical protein pdam_00004612 [Pocillopora damicornis]